MKKVVVAAMAGVAALLAPSAPAASLKAPSCRLVSNAKMTRLLGVRIVSTAVVTDEAPNQTACGYNTSLISEDATIVYTTKAGKGVYTVEKTEAGRAAKAVPGLGGDAFSFIVATGEGDGLQPGSTYPTDGPEREIDLLVGNVEVRINAYAPIARVEALAKAVLTSL